MKKFLKPAAGIAVGLVIWQLLPGVAAKAVAFVVCTAAVAYAVRRDRKRTTALLLTVAILSASALPPAPVTYVGPAVEIQAAEMALPPWAWAASAIAAGAFYDAFFFLAMMWWDQASECCEGSGERNARPSGQRPPPPTCLVAGRNTYTGCVDP